MHVSSPCGLFLEPRLEGCWNDIATAAMAEELVGITDFWKDDGNKGVVAERQVRQPL